MVGSWEDWSDMFNRRWGQIESSHSIACVGVILQFPPSFASPDSCYRRILAI